MRSLLKSLQRRIFKMLALPSSVVASTLLLSFASPASAVTPMQTYVEAMQPGTNWGNTLDATPDRHSWGAPETTQAMIQGLKAKGYKSLRIPITWGYSYTGPAPGYAIDPEFMAHVQQVVDWALAADLYVMINMHHDSYWLRELPADAFAKYEAIWTQVANRFKDYPNKLSFESINEPGFHGANGQDLPPAQMQEVLNEINDTFYSIVRGSGGANATRPLVLPTVYTSTDQPYIGSLKAFIVGKNDPNLIATIHNYGYYPFSVNMGGVTKFDDLVKHWLEVPFNALYDTFVSSGVPVIIGEWGVLAGDNIERGELLKFHEYVAQLAWKKTLTTMLWDTGGVYNRTTQDWQPANRDLAEIIHHAEMGGRATSSESDLLFLRSDTVNQDSVINLNLNGNSVVSVQDGATTLIPTTDYTLAGSVLTLKAGVLAKYASAPFGEKTTLTINANSGPAWKIHVRFAAPPVASALTSFSGTELSVPVAFNGDLLATIESRYADGSNAGPVGWSAFPFWGSDFHPDYANNAIVLSSGFLSSAPVNSVINFKFHFWSGNVLSYQMQVKPPVSTVGPDYVFYGDSLPPGWNDWSSWMAHDLASTAQVHTGSNSISITPSAWGGVSLQQNSWEQPLDTSGFRTLVFWVHGGAAGGQNIGLHLIFGTDWSSSAWVGLPALVANTWQKIEIPLSNLNAEGRPNITGVSFRHFRGEDAPTFYIDDIHLSTAYASWQLQITGTPMATPPAPALEITRSGIHVDNSTGRLVQTVQVHNPGSQAVTGPIYLVLDGLSTNATLANATGWTSRFVPVGTPYITVTTADIAPGKKATVKLEFSAPTSSAGGLPGGFNHAVTYTPRVLSAGTQP